MIAILGVDPGVNGALALLDPRGNVERVDPLDPKMTEAQGVKVVRSIVRLWADHWPRACYMEKVGYMPTDGGKGAFTFGRIVGLLSGSLLTAGVDVKYVQPAIWQSHLGCLSGGNKNVTKAKAAELFPSIKWTHKTADAALIAEYGRRLELGL